MGYNQKLINLNAAVGISDSTGGNAEARDVCGACECTLKPFCTLNLGQTNV